MSARYLIIIRVDHDRKKLLKISKNIWIVVSYLYWQNTNEMNHIKKKKTIFEFLSKIKTIYVDSIIKHYCKTFFCKLFTVHGLVNNYYVPLVIFFVRK